MHPLGNAIGAQSQLFGGRLIIKPLVDAELDHSAIGQVQLFQGCCNPPELLGSLESFDGREVRRRQVLIV